jgi:TRAP-type C4-dicarboxylate transport system permease small subunit
VQDALTTLARITGLIARLGLWLASLGLVLMTAFIAWQVFGRYVLNSSPSWTEPAAVMLMSWFIFLGAAVGVREGYHLSFDVVLYFLPEGARKALHTVSDVVVMGFGGAMMWFGLDLVLGTWRATLPSLGLPGGMAFLALVSGGALVSLFSLERILRRAAGRVTARFGETELPVE